jgi:hypothetical protein
LGSSLGFEFSACRIANSDLSFCSFPAILWIIVILLIAGL